MAPLAPEITSHILKLQEAVSQPPGPANSINQFPFTSATYLNTFLFGGLEKCMPPGTAVTIALPPEFAGIPLGALLRSEPSRDGESYDIRNAPWLIRDLSFSVVLSARHYLATVAGSERKVAPRPFLGVGDPTLDAVKLASTEAFQRSVKTRNGVLDFQELPETIGELRAAGKLFGAPASDILLGKLGTEAALRAKPLADYDVLHFATHGLLKDDIAGLSNSALLLTPGNIQDKFDDGILSASEIARLPLNARLVVLSACNTAKYDLAYAGRSVQDFQAAFTIAGAPTLLGSLWPVDSAVARDMMISFFKEWRSPESTGAASALAKATRDFLNRSDASHQHPWYWAPYVIAGNGAVPGRPIQQLPATALTYTVLDGFESGGEIIHAAPIGSDTLFAMSADWDGKKMNGIITRRSITGVEKWRVASREIGIGRIATNGKAIYATGYTTEQNPIPVFRSFDTNGRLQWETELADLRGYSFADLIVTPKGMLTVGYPRFLSEPLSDHALVLVLDGAGKVRSKSKIKIEPRKPNFAGIDALIGVWGHGIIVIINNGLSVGDKPPDKDTLSGLPQLCQFGASASIYEIDQRTLKTVAMHSISDFRASSLLPIGDQLYIGGEALNSCSPKGIASIFRLNRTDEPRRLWEEDEIFNSAVRGMVNVGNGLVVAVGHERRVGIEIPMFTGIDPDYKKHWMEESGAQYEGSLIALSKDGALISRQFLSAGMSTYVQGIEASRDGSIIYGTLGGMPWVALSQKPPAVVRTKSESGKVSKNPSRKWWQLW